MEFSLILLYPNLQTDSPFTDRSAKFLKNILDGFTGSVITDGYASYNFLNSKNNIIHAGSNTHARRKFVEADKVSKNNPDTLKVLNLYT